LRHFDPVHTIPSYLCKIHFNIFNLTFVKCVGLRWRHTMTNTNRPCNKCQKQSLYIMSMLAVSQLPIAAARVGVQVMWDMDKVALGQIFLVSTSVSPANSHSTDSSTLIIYHLGLVQ
jgi:hypothetical protein